MKSLKAELEESTGFPIQESFGDKFREKIFRFFHPFSKQYPRPYIIITEGRTNVSSGGSISKDFYNKLCEYFEQKYESYIREFRVQRTVDMKLDNRIYILDKDQTTYKILHSMIEDVVNYIQSLADEIGGERMLVFPNKVSGGHELEISIEVVENSMAAYPGISFNTFRKHESPILKRLERITQKETTQMNNDYDGADVYDEPQPRRRAGYRQQFQKDAEADDPSSAFVY